MSPASAAALLASCPTAKSALEASIKAHDANRHDLGDALFAHASILRMSGYPVARASLIGQRDALLAASPEPEATP